MSAYHTPVLLAEILELMAPAPTKVFVDGTLGGGGHAHAIAERLRPGGLLLGLDQDRDALAEAAIALETVQDTIRLRHANFAQILDAVAAEGLPAVDGVLLDLGVSSHQLDVPSRGFAFRSQGPLDMRMDPSRGETAAELIDRLSEAELTRVLFEYGEESRARRIAAQIVRARPIATTEALVDAVRRAMPLRTRPGQIHPATRTFQALRIAVNDELGALTRGLHAAVHALAPGGRIAVISYHSLEDRIVKETFNTLSGKRVGSDLPDPTPVPDPVLTIITRKPVIPGDDEIRANPRARSAKLRVAERR
jgi:16S rRNA (cytosine1402-N4)-methyltransferase